MKICYAHSQTKACPEDEVKTYDPNSEQLESVTGILYDGKDKVVEICSDES